MMQSSKKKEDLQDKAGGTGHADEDDFEDDCIASFSDEADDDQINGMSLLQKNTKSLTLN